MTIRDLVSQSLMVKIIDWDIDINRLSRDGGITQRVLQDMFVILCKKIEEMEKNEQSTGQNTKKPL